jgi:hypothetical protein
MVIGLGAKMVCPQSRTPGLGGSVSEGFYGVLKVSCGGKILSICSFSSGTEQADFHGMKGQFPGFREGRFRSNRVLRSVGADMLQVEPELATMMDAECETPRVRVALEAPIRRLTDDVESPRRGECGWLCSLCPLHAAGCSKASVDLQAFGQLPR